MQAGYANVTITPPLGTRLSGFGGRDRAGGATGVADDLSARILYVEDGGAKAVVAGFDILFFSRENDARLRKAIAAATGAPPAAILLNCSHTHVGPCVDTWGSNAGAPPERTYMDQLETTVARGAATAAAAARPVTIRAGADTTRLPISRRRPDGKGSAEWRPYPEGLVCRHLPVCLLEDSASGKPVCLLFSVSCHPSTMSGHRFSADYPGAACRRLDNLLGATCSLFLQGAGGDTKACTIADGRDAAGGPTWRSGNTDDIAAAGWVVFEEVRSVLGTALAPRRPRVRAGMVDSLWPFQALPTRADLERAAAGQNEILRTWAASLLGVLNSGSPLPAAAPVRIQRIDLAEDVRLVAIEGELVGELGNHVIAGGGAGLTFALGYSNGTGLYLPSSRMVPEGGYEVDSYYEYGFPARLAPGVEQVIDGALAALA